MSEKKNQLSFAIMTDFVENRKTKQHFTSKRLYYEFIVDPYTTKKKIIKSYRERTRSLVDIQLFEKLYQYH